MSLKRSAQIASVGTALLAGTTGAHAQNECWRVLQGGLFEITNTASEKELDQLIDSELFKERQSSESTSKGKSGGGSIGYGGFSLGLSGSANKQTLKTIADRYEKRDFKDFNRDDKLKVYEMVSAEHARDLIEAYKLCESNQSQSPQVVSDWNIHGQQVAVRFWWHEMRSNNPQPWPKITDVTCTGGRFIGEVPKSGAVLDRSYSLVVQRDANADQVTIVVNTDRGPMRPVIVSSGEFKASTHMVAQRGFIKLPEKVTEWVKVTEDDGDVLWRRYVEVQFEKPFLGTPEAGITRFNVRPPSDGTKGGRLLTVWCASVTERRMILVIRTKNRDEANGLDVRWMAVGELPK